MKKNNSIKAYWRRSVIYPVVVACLAISIFAGALIAYSASQRKRERDRELTKNLSLIVSEPLLLGNQIETLKRISRLAESHGVTVELYDKTGALFSRFPAFSSRVKSTENKYRRTSDRVLDAAGAQIGTIHIYNKDHYFDFNWFLLFLGVLGVSSILLGWWIIKKARSIINDSLGLEKIANSHFTIEDLDAFRFSETREVAKKIFDYTRLLSESEKIDAQNKIARQVAHDIRSPLTAFAVAQTALSQLPEDKRLLIRTAIQRIHDIANDLLKTVKNSNSALYMANTHSGAPDPDLTRYPEHIASLVESIVAEKRVTLGLQGRIQIKLETRDTYSLFSMVYTSQLLRAFSNLINNAIESFGAQGGIVSISVSKHENTALVQITDNGCGIPADILPRLGKEKISYGKTNSPSGNGMGVHHAFETIQKIGGSLSYESISSRDFSDLAETGTRVTICLPTVAPPTWFARHIQISPQSKITVVDDDPSVHEAWKSKFSLFGSTLLREKMSHFFDISELIEHYRENPPSFTDVLLIDLEYANSANTGLMFLEKKIHPQATFLVTSHFNDPMTRVKCLALNIQIVPKTLVNEVPILWLDRRQELSTHTL